MILPQILAAYLFTTSFAHALVPRQDSPPPGVTVVTTSVFPGGVARSNSSLESTLPLPCIDGCWASLASYAVCFGGVVYPDRPDTKGSDNCTQACNQSTYDQMVSCLNCIVANGDERGFGYATNTSITAAPTPPAGSRLPYNANGLFDAEQANGLLRNVTEGCASAGRPLTGASSVTAVPTTTGPYQTSWTSGATITRTPWTGLAQYSAPIYTLTVTTNRPPASSGSGTGPSGIASGAASQTSTGAGYARPKASEAVIGALTGMVIAVGALLA